MLFVYMDIQSQLNKIAAERQSLLQQTPEDRENEELQKLHTTMLQAQQAEKIAPRNTADAEENYNKARYGSQYQDVQLEKYVYRSQKVSADMLSSHKKKLKKLDDALKTYSSTITYAKNLEEVKQSLNDKIQVLVKQIQGSTASLNNRTAYYTEVSLLNLSRFILVENVFLTAYVLIMLLDIQNVNRKELIIILFILFFSDLFLTLLHKIPNSITSYTEWGYDPMESKTHWFLTMLILICFVIFLTFIQTINEFFSKLRYL